MQISETKKQKRILFLNLFLSGIMFTTAGADMFEDKLFINVPDYRLSQDIIPIHYDINLTLQTNIREIEFGECDIKIIIKNATSVINLHSSNMKILEEWTGLVNKYGRKFKPVEHKLNLTMQILNLKFPIKIPSGTYILHIKYVPLSILYNEQGAGYVFIKFPVKESISLNRHEKRLFATKIQSIEARRVFPCWDEPHYVATFKIDVNHHAEWKVLSNVPATRTKVDLSDENWLWTEFNTVNNTISTRDVAIAIIDALESSTQFTLNNVWSRFHLQAPEMQFGNEIMPKILALPSFAAQIFPTHVSTPIQKIIVPCMKHDFIGKLGLVIYKEELFMHDVEIDTIVHKIEVARTIVRGMIHYQLDNTVPHFWWSQQWFNEAFFIFLQIEILDKIIPDWQSLDLFVIQIQHEALHLDTDFYIRPLSYVGNTPSEIESLFSYPFYVKAPAILRMLQHAIGLEKFKWIMNICLTNICFDYIIPQLCRMLYYQIYRMSDNELPIEKMEIDCVKLKRKSFHLFIILISKEVEASLSSYDVLQSVIQLNLDKSKLHNYTIKDIMDGWTNRSNYPIIEVTRLQSDNIVLIKPYRYHLNGDITLYNVHTRMIPITFTTQKQIDFLNTKPIQWLIPQYQENITISLNENDWIIVNLQQTGYYRVKYDYTNWELIANYLNSIEYKNIHVINRAQLIDDAYHFWVAHQLNYTMFRKLSGYLRQETDFVAWYPMFQVFRYISQFLPFEEIKPLQDHMLYILSVLHNKLNYTESSNETDLIKCLRQEAARWACTFGDLKCQTFVSALLQNYLKDPIKHKLLPGWKDWIYCKSSKPVNKDSLTKLRDVYTSTLFNYFPCAKLIDIVPASDILLYLRILMGSKTIKNIYIPCQFIVKHAIENIDNIATNFKFYNSMISNKIKLLCIIINNAYSEYQINKINQFIQDVLIDNIKNDMQNIFYIINKRLCYIKNQRDKLMELLEI